MGFQEAFLRHAGSMIDFHRRSDTEADRRSEAVLWVAIGVVAQCSDPTSAAEALRAGAKFSRDIERLCWFALAGFMDEQARLLARLRSG